MQPQEDALLENYGKYERREVTTEQACAIMHPDPISMVNKSSVVLFNDSLLCSELREGKRTYQIYGIKERYVEILNQLSAGETGLTKYQMSEKNRIAKAGRSLRLMRANRRYDASA